MWIMNGDMTGASDPAAIDYGRHYQMIFLHYTSGLGVAARRKPPFVELLIEMKRELMKARSERECREDRKTTRSILRLWRQVAPAELENAARQMIREYSFRLHWLLEEGS